MSDNVVQTLQKLVQDVIAPDVRELKVRMESHAKETDARFKAVDIRFDTLEKQIDSMEKRILSAIAESKAQTDLANMSEVYSLRERVAVLEAKAA